jgi:uncharacterized protein with HEPN domain
VNRAARLVDYLRHIEQASVDACSFTADMTKDGFLADKRTQQAVVMSLIVIGEAATKVVLEHPDFAATHGEVPWAGMKGMRNRMAHGYWDVDLHIVWETVQSSLPLLLAQLPPVLDEARRSAQSSPNAPKA